MLKPKGLTLAEKLPVGRTTSQWRAVADRFAAAADRLYSTKPTRKRALIGGALFLEWLIKNDWAPDELPADVGPQFVAWLRGTALSTHIRAGARRAANEILTEVEAMNGTADEMVELEEVQPPQPQEVRIKVEAPGQRRPPAAPRQRDPQATMFPKHSIKVRVSKRFRDGHRAFIDEWEVDDIGQAPLAKFLKEYVDPTHGEPDGRTTYEVQRVNLQTEQPMGPSMTFTIESEPRPAQPPDEISQLRNVVEVMRDLKDDASQEKDALAGAMRALTEKIATGGGMSDMMMLMLLQQVQRSNASGDDVDKLLRVMERMRGPNAPPLGMDAAPVPPIVPVSPTTDALGNIATTLIQAQTELVREKNAAPPPPPPPPPKTTLEMAQELRALKDLFAPPPAPPPPPAPDPMSFLSNAVAMVKGMADLTKTIAPPPPVVPDDGGILGVLGRLAERIITPDLAKSIGNGLALAAEGYMQKAKVAAVTQQAAQAVQARGAGAARPVRLPPAAARQYVDALRAAKEENEQIANVLFILNAYYADPQWQPMLHPYALAAQAGEVDKVRHLIGDELLPEMRPDLAADKAFVDKVVSALMEQVKAATQPEPPAVTPVVEVPPNGSPAGERAA